MRWRRSALAAGLLAALVRGQEELALLSATAKVVDALTKAGEARISSRAHEDHWLIAIGLCQRGHWDLALAFARKVPETEGRKLIEYLEGIRATRVPPGKDGDVAVRKAASPEAMADSQAVLRAMDEASRQCDAWEQARITLAMAELLKRLGRRNEAVDAWRRAAALAKDVGWLAGAARALDSAGLLVVTMPGGVESAISLWEGSAEASRIRGDRHAQAWTSFWLGNAYGQRGSYSTALACYARTRELAQGEAAPDLQAFAGIHEGSVHARRGALGRAQASFTAALEAEQRVDDLMLRSSARLSLANVLSQLGDTERATGLADQALGELQVSDEARLLAEPTARRHAGLLADAHGTLGVIQLWARRPEQARSGLERSLAIHLAIGNVPKAVVARTNIGMALFQLGSLAEAETVLRVALDQALATEDPYLEAEVRYHLGRLLARTGPAGEAAANDLRLLAIGEALRSAHLLFRGQLNVARRMLDAGQLREAVAAATLAAVQVQRLVSGLAFGSDSAAREDRYERQEVFELGVRAALAIPDAAALFWMLECSRARAVVESLGGAEEVEGSAFAGSAVAGKAAAVEEVAIARSAAAAVGQAGGVEAIESARAKLDQAETRLGEVVALLEREAPGVAEMVAQRTATLDAIKATLAAGEAIVLYAPDDTRAIALVITRDQADIVKLDVPADLEQRCAMVLDATGRVRSAGRPAGASDERDWQKQVDELRRRLWTPLGLGAAVRTVLVAPYGALAQLPFCLFDTDREIDYVPSGSTLKVLRDRRRAGKGILAVGDPLVADRSPLPASATEVAAIGDEVLTREAATAAGLRKALAGSQRWRALHIASHGEIDLTDPLKSSLRLSPTADHDGRLTVNSILGMRVPADIVVLAACDTARGKVFRSEGVLGFTRAFFCAGASSVLVSLWKVDDVATKELMTRFHSSMKVGGVSAAGALRKAQLELKASSLWAAPRFWAGWQLWGLPDP